jgi:hypothetical protein
MIDKKFRLARLWSNKELKKVSHFFSGSIVNVSAWDDRDKEGGYYKNYFKNATDYYYTNYSGIRGKSNLDNEFDCDLTKELPSELENKFDVAFNHTTLEHIFDVRKAFSNICKMSKDIVIIVVPFCQAQHETEDWKDYWRFSPTVLRSLFKENGLNIVYESWNNNRNAAVYLFCVGSKNVGKWKNKFKSIKNNKPDNCGDWVGESFFDKFLKIVKKFL